MLSQNILGDAELDTCNSPSRFLIHSTSAAHDGRARYLAYVKEQATNSCFLEHQEMTFPPRYTMNAEVDERSSQLLAQSASVKPVTLSYWWGLRKRS